MILRNLRLTAATAVIGTSILAPRAGAQVFSFSNQDIFLDFSKSGSPDYEVNLGLVTQITTLSPQSTISFTTGGGAAYTPASLLANFGGSLDGVSFAAFAGSPSAANGVAANTAFETWSRATPSTQNTTGPTDSNTSKTVSIISQINGLAGIDNAADGAVLYGGGHPGSSLSSTAIEIPTASVDSYTSLFGGTGGLKSLVTARVQNTAPVSFSSGYVASDFYRLIPHTGTPALQGAYLGDFQLGSDGQLLFTNVPEPREYAVFTSAALVGLAVWRRRRQSAAK